nr:type II secretion system protein [Caulifigura coniformis]
MRRLSSVQTAAVRSAGGQPAAVQSAAGEPATECSRGRSARRGFSMVELLIVITIIAILVSLLLVGVQAAVGRARVATVVSELKNLEQAIKAFESEFGMQPPSFILLYERGSDWTANDQWTRASRSIIRQLWKDYDFTQNVDFDGDGNTGGVYKTFRLTGAECLVFFLGGMVSVDNSVTPPVYTPKGFSKVPANPFGRQAGGALGGARSGPFYEFKSTQLLSSTSTTTGSTNPEGMYVYLDAIPGQTRPIQYFSSYGGSGYRVYGINGQLGASASSTEAGDNEAFYDSFGWVYTKTPGSASTAPEPYNPNTFQLISPGLDGEYGDANLCGGYVNATNGVQGVTTYLPPGTLPAGGTLAKTPANIARERDNITNFAGGEIH